MQNIRSSLRRDLFVALQLAIGLQFLSPDVLFAGGDQCRTLFESGAEHEVARFSLEPKIWNLDFHGLKLTVRQIPELESRVSFTNSKIWGTNQGLTSYLIRNHFPGANEAIEKLKKNRSLRESTEAASAQGVWLAPLSSKFEILHDTVFAELETGGPKKIGALQVTTVAQKAQAESALPNSELMDGTIDLPNIGSIDPRGSGRDKMTIHHWVSWYAETGLYFDTPDRALEKSGWAVRIKILSEKDQAMSSQFLVPRGRDLQKAKRMTLTIKYSPGKLVGPFTRRIEFHVFLPLEFSLELAGELAATVLNSIEPSTFNSLPKLTPVTRVDTDRMGLNVMAQLTPDGRPTKVGFVTIDRFTRLVAEPNSEYPGYVGSGLQTELEILPDFFVTLDSHPSLWTDLTSLAKSIASGSGGKFDHEPKYVTPEVKGVEPRPDN
jgi:hypothetical protein